MFLEQKTLREKVICKQRRAPGLLSDCSERAGVGRGAYIDPPFFKKKAGRGTHAFMYAANGAGEKRKQSGNASMSHLEEGKKGENRRGAFFNMFHGSIYGTIFSMHRLFCGSSAVRNAKGQCGPGGKGAPARNR